MDNFPKCLVCEEHFTLKGPTPYLLPCLHAVCETCVTSTAGGVISCTPCQGEVSLAETHLQKDVVRQREIFHLTVQHRPSELLCTHEEDGNQAVCWCQECEELLCEFCQNMHQSFKLTRNHTIQDVGDIHPWSLANEKYCGSHKKYPLDLWDRSCNILICARCKREDHAAHDVEDVDEAAASTREEMEAQETEIQAVAATHNSLLKKTREHLSRMDESSSRLMDNVNHTFSSLRSLLDQREKELLTVRKQDIEQMKDKLNTTATISESGHLKCKTTADYIKKILLYSSKYDLLSLRQSIRDTTKLCISPVPSERRDDHPFPVFSTEGLDKLKTIMAAFGDASQRLDIKTVHETGIQTGITEHEKDCDTFEEETIRLKRMITELEISDAAHKSEISTLLTEIEQKSKEADKFEQDARHLTSRILELQESEKVLREEKMQLETKCQQKTKANAELERIVQESNKAQSLRNASLVNIGLSPEANYHLLTSTRGDKSVILQCIYLKLDRDKVHENVCINLAGDLVNKRGFGQRVNSFQKYKGTSSTHALLQCGSPQYWEVKVKIGIDNPLEKNLLLLEIGICRDENKDQHHSISGQCYSYALNVVHCKTHNSVCRQVSQRDIYGTCLPHTLPNSHGQSTTLHYGVVFDDSRNKIVFLDIIENKVISTIDDVDCGKPLWPMFGVYNRQYASVSMSLVVDFDINMWDGKKDMIRKSLL